MPLPAGTCMGHFTFYSITAQHFSSWNSANLQVFPFFFFLPSASACSYLCCWWETLLTLPAPTTSHQTGPGGQVDRQGVPPFTCALLLEEPYHLPPSPLLPCPAPFPTYLFSPLEGEWGKGEKRGTCLVCFGVVTCLFTYMLVCLCL